MADGLSAATADSILAAIVQGTAYSQTAITVSAEPRTFTVPAEDRTFTVPA